MDIERKEVDAGRGQEALLVAYYRRRYREYSFRLNIKGPSKGREDKGSYALRV